MPDAITNTSPLIYLDRIHRLEWLPKLFDEFWVPTAVVDELNEGRNQGHPGLDLSEIAGTRVVEPEARTQRNVETGCYTDVRCR